MSLYIPDRTTTEMTPKVIYYHVTNNVRVFDCKDQEVYATTYKTKKDRARLKRFLNKWLNSQLPAVTDDI